ncbi:hypothetical protein EV646_109280 [Kribbella antiqua]|uniref:Uncharacterized protein n=1 Tax=Kribbella antiqua TaxID=2512217 RepID=A0A4R2IQQ6_9ACTN|nr:hypothetical protein EV646_109280 [Kribbella antiqua]
MAGCRRRPRWLRGAAPGVRRNARDEGAVEGAAPGVRRIARGEGVVEGAAPGVRRIARGEGVVEGAAPGCVMVLVRPAGVKGASFVGVAARSSTLDTHHPNQGRTQLSRSCSPEWSRAGGGYGWCGREACGPGRAAPEVAVGPGPIAGCVMAGGLLAAIDQTTRYRAGESALVPAIWPVSSACRDRPGLAQEAGARHRLFPVSAPQYLCQPTSTCPNPPRRPHPDPANTQTTRSRNHPPRPRATAPRGLRIAASFLVGVVGVKGRRSRSDADEGRALDAHHPDQHTHAAKPAANHLHLNARQTRTKRANSTPDVCG